MPPYDRDADIAAEGQRATRVDRMSAHLALAEAALHAPERLPGELREIAAKLAGLDAARVCLAAANVLEAQARGLRMAAEEFTAIRALMQGALTDLQGPKP